MTVARSLDLVAKQNRRQGLSPVFANIAAHNDFRNTARNPTNPKPTRNESADDTTGASRSSETLSQQVVERRVAGGAQ